MNNIFKIFVLIFLLITNRSFSQKANDILPIELIYFEAQLTYSGVLLRWGTATEVNNFGFEIQRADSTLQFYGIDFVPGSGTSNSPKHYFYIDSTLTEAGIYFYRLKQIDIDGPYHYSDTVSINFHPTTVELNRTKSQLKIFITNNIHLKELNIQFLEEFDSEVSITTYSLLGEKVFEKTFYPTQTFQTINYSNFPSGIYFLSITSGKKLLSVFKFISIH